MLAEVSTDTDSVAVGTALITRPALVTSVGVRNVLEATRLEGDKGVQCCIIPLGPILRSNASIVVVEKE